MATTPGLAPPEHRLKRNIGPVGLLFTGIGSIIGSGWLFGAFNASGIAGPAAIFSWLIAAVLILLIGLTYAELGPMFPISGGVVRYPHLIWGSFTSYSLGWITWISTAAVPAIEVEGALQYATKYAGFTTAHSNTTHTLTLLGFVVAVALLAIFVIINYFGVRLFSQLNLGVVWWKLAIIVLTVVVFLVLGFQGVSAGASGHLGGTANFTSHGFVPYGTEGIFLAISTAGITFSFLGFRQGIELAGETDHPHRNIPLAVVGSVLITGLIYALLQVAFTLATPTGALGKGWVNVTFANDFGPLAGIATLAGVTWLAYLLYADAIISPSGTGFIYTAVAARVSYAMGRNRNAPAALARNNVHGVPYLSLLLTFVVGVILFLPFPSWQQLVGFITSATVISFGTGPLALATLRREMPDRHRPFRLPGGDVIPFLAFYAANMIVYWGGWSTDKKLFATIGIGYVVLVIFELTGDRRHKPPLDLRAGAPWVIPWFVAMTVISLTCDPETHHTLFNWVFLINLGVSAVIYGLAIKLRLPKGRTEHLIAEAEDESAVEESTLGI